MVILNTITKHNLENTAHSLLESYRYDWTYDTFVDITALSVFTGFSVKESSALFCSLFDAILYANNHHKAIRVSRVLSKELKRLAIAFLLADYIICGNSICILKSEVQKPSTHWFDKAEHSKQAYLALCLLMPKESFANQVKILREHGIDSALTNIALKNTFAVPKELVSFWLKSI